LIVTKMSQLLSLDFKKTVAKFIEILERYDYEGSRSLWECIDKYGIDLQPFLRAMTSRSYDKASEYRSVLQHLDLRTTVLLAGRDLINEFTSKLMRGRFSFWNATGEEGSTNLVQVFQHTLFLQLFYMRSDPSFDLVLDSIKDISKADDDQKAVLKQVHMTALSGSYNERLWRYFYTRMPAT